MDWEHVRNQVESQIGYWRAVGKQDWAETLEHCLAKAERVVRCPQCRLRTTLLTRRKLLGFNPALRLGGAFEKRLRWTGRL
jgi:hypothetical protein